MTPRMERRDLLRATVALTGVAAFGGLTLNQASAQASLRLTWWGSEERHSRTIEALELFSQRYPDITVTPEALSWDAYVEKIAVQTAGGNAPDVFQMSGTIIHEYSARGALLDLAPFVPDVINLSTWDENVRDFGLIDGELTGLPIGVDAYTVVYDQTVLADNGLTMPDTAWTWDEFAVFATEVSEALGEGFYGTSDAAHRYEGLETFVRQRGKTLFSADGTALGFEKADLIEWWTFWDELRQAGVAPPADVQVAASSNEVSTLVQGTAPLWFTTSGQLVNLQGLTEHELGLHTLPHSADGESGAFVRPGLFISASATTEYPDESAQLIEFLLNDPDAAAVLMTARGVPPAPAIREVLIPQVSPEDQKAFEFIDVITDISTQANILTPPGGSDVTDLMTRTYEAIAFGQMTVEEGADTVFEQAPSLLGA